MKHTIPSTVVPSLLYIDASPRLQRSQSRKLGQKFLAAWRAAHPTASVVIRDLAQEPPPFVTEAWSEGAFTPPEQHSPAARDAIAVSNRLVDELLAADQVVYAHSLAAGESVSRQAVAAADATLGEFAKEVAA